MPNTIFVSGSRTQETVPVAQRGIYAPVDLSGARSERRELNAFDTFIGRGHDGRCDFLSVDGDAVEWQDIASMRVDDSIKGAHILEGIAGRIAPGLKRDGIPPELASRAAYEVAASLADQGLTWRGEEAVDAELRAAKPPQAPRRIDDVVARGMNIEVRDGRILVCITSRFRTVLVNQAADPEAREEADTPPAEDTTDIMESDVFMEFRIERTDGILRKMFSGLKTSFGYSGEPQYYRVVGSVARFHVAAMAPQLQAYLIKESGSLWNRLCDLLAHYFNRAGIIYQRSEPRDYDGSWLLAKRPKLPGIEDNGGDRYGVYAFPVGHNDGSGRLPWVVVGGRASQVSLPAAAKPMSEASARAGESRGLPASSGGVPAEAPSAHLQRFRQGLGQVLDEHSGAGWSATPERYVAEDDEAYPTFFFRDVGKNHLTMVSAPVHDLHPAPPVPPGKPQPKLPAEGKAPWQLMPAGRKGPAQDTADRSAREVAEGAWEEKARVMANYHEEMGLVNGKRSLVDAVADALMFCREKGAQDARVVIPVWQVHSPFFDPDIGHEQPPAHWMLAEVVIEQGKVARIRVDNPDVAQSFDEAEHIRAMLVDCELATPACPARTVLHQAWRDASATTDAAWVLRSIDDSMREAPKPTVRRPTPPLVRQGSQWVFKPGQAEIPDPRTVESDPAPRDGEPTQGAASRKKKVTWADEQSNRHRISDKGKGKEKEVERDASATVSGASAETASSGASFSVTEIAFRMRWLVEDLGRHVDEVIAIGINGGDAPSTGGRPPQWGYISRDENGARLILDPVADTVVSDVSDVSDAPLPVTDAVRAVLAVSRQSQDEVVAWIPVVQCGAYLNDKVQRKHVVLLQVTARDGEVTHAVMCDPKPSDSLGYQGARRVTDALREAGLVGSSFSIGTSYFGHQEVEQDTMIGVSCVMTYIGLLMRGDANLDVIGCMSREELRDLDAVGRMSSDELREGGYTMGLGIA